MSADSGTPQWMLKLEQDLLSEKIGVNEAAKQCVVHHGRFPAKWLAKVSRNFAHFCCALLCTCGLFERAAAACSAQRSH